MHLEPPPNFELMKGYEFYVNDSKTLGFDFRDEHRIEIFIYKQGWFYITNEDYLKVKVFIEFI